MQCSSPCIKAMPAAMPATPPTAASSLSRFPICAIRTGDRVVAWPSASSWKQGSCVTPLPAASALHAGSGPHEANPNTQVDSSTSAALDPFCWQLLYASSLVAPAYCGGSSSFVISVRRVRTRHHRMVAWTRHKMSSRQRQPFAARN